MSKGTLHIFWINRSEPSAPEQYQVMFGRALGQFSKSGTLKARAVDGQHSLKVLLQRDLQLPSDKIDAALQQLAEAGKTDIAELDLIESNLRVLDLM